MRSRTRIAEADKATQTPGHAASPAHAQTQPEPTNRDGGWSRPGSTETLRRLGQNEPPPRPRPSRIGRAERGHGLLAVAFGQYKTMSAPATVAVPSRAATSLHPRRRAAGQDQASAAPTAGGGFGFVAIGGGKSRGSRRAATPVGAVPTEIALPDAINTAAADGRRRQANGPRAPGPGAAPRHEAGVARDGTGEQMRVDRPGSHRPGRGGGRSSR